MYILPNIRIVGLALFLEKERTLVVGDLHIGYEEALNRGGLLVPRVYFKEMMQNLEKIMREVKPELIVLLGDVKHEFGTISRQEWKDALSLLDYLTAKTRVVILKGNHDKILGPIARRKEVELRESLSIGDVLLCHGDKLMPVKSAVFKKAKTMIIGHEHPAIGIRDSARIERYKCFLRGKYGRKNLIVVPSFNFVTEGTDVLQEKLLSPFLKNLDDFEAFVVADKTYAFGKIGKMSRLN
ncbi:MAG: metallophosphoesterase [archaeon]